MEAGGMTILCTRRMAEEAANEHKKVQEGDHLWPQRGELAEKELDTKIERSSCPFSLDKGGGSWAR
jgi:hypothetical protein